MPPHLKALSKEGHSFFTLVDFSVRVKENNEFWAVAVVTAALVLFLKESVTTDSFYAEFFSYNVEVLHYHHDYN